MFGTAIENLYKHFIKDPPKFLFPFEDIATMTKAQIYDQMNIHFIAFKEVYIHLVNHKDTVRDDNNMSEMWSQLASSTNALEMLNIINTLGCQHINNHLPHTNS